MPYSVDKPPRKVRKLSAKKQRKFVHVYNSCHARGYDTARCHRMAWGAVKKDCAVDMLADFNESAVEKALKNPKRYATTRRGKVRFDIGSKQDRLLHGRGLAHSHVTVGAGGKKKVTRYP